jgi:hypothetical protein
VHAGRWWDRFVTRHPNRSQLFAPMALSESEIEEECIAALVDAGYLSE